MNAPWKSGLPGNRDPFAAYICDDAALDVLRPVVIEMGWPPEKCNKGGLRNVPPGRFPIGHKGGLRDAPPDALHSSR